jgi:uncharacterized GH25 family protein
MNRFPSPSQRRRNVPFFAAPLAAFAALLIVASAQGHEVWIEVPATGQVGQQHEIQVCWGHSLHREGGESLKSQQGRLTAWWVVADSPRQQLSLTPKSDHFAASFAPTAEGICQIVAQSQVGILDREFHGIPAKTRIIMAGKSLVRVGKACGEQKIASAMDLDLTPLAAIDGLRPGGVFAAKVTFKQKPVGGPSVVATLSTLGNTPFPKDSEVEGIAWSVKNTAHPTSGEVRFPLIVPGRHILNVRYTDETPGQYDGDLNFETKFSRLRKGDTYERTLHVATLTFDVPGQ